MPFSTLPAVFRRALIAALLLCLLPLRPAQAQDVSEYGVKAILFYRLSQFVYWPADNKPPTPLTLCVVGRNPFGSALTQIDQSVATIEARQSPSDLGSCQLLFIPRSEAGNLEAWLSRTENRRLVTVSDIPGFARAGGMIELPLEGERVNIVINRRSARRNGFEFNAQLLRLARVIEP
ncbi:YfiR family protein [Dechloromonas sp. XY25]|uniref:YfiR family protein n=1 Tax=Dechloromonas hankyongensis TaxID=2908002 RepID=A0ABS9JZQ6_9RHOO|nr:YfiR family protein [Dechloromonas hankyongensis]MCG2576386.1 YfiR family protein [Dechloromonas hankyongensis]